MFTSMDFSKPSIAKYHVGNCTIILFDCNYITCPLALILCLGTVKYFELNPFVKTMRDWLIRGHVINVIFALRGRWFPAPTSCKHKK